MPKTTKKKSSAKKAAPVGNKPQILTSKGGMTGKQLLDRVLAMMEEENWLTKKQGKDFADSLVAVVEEEIEKGKPVNLFGLVRIVPRLHTAGEREVYKEFGNPDSGKVIKKVKAKTSFKTGQGIFGKKLKDAMPSTTKLAKVIDNG
jgi:nucleoid DNA-binding protein